jgi:hypothetical protein
MRTVRGKAGNKGREQREVASGKGQWKGREKGKERGKGAEERAHAAAVHYAVVGALGVVSVQQMQVLQGVTIL